MSNKLDLEIKQGQDESFLLTIKDENGAPQDLTGFTFKGEARDQYQGKLFFSFSFDVKNQTTDTGKVEMILSRSATSRLKVAGKTILVYDVEMTSSTTTRIIEGKINFTPEVTL